VSCSAAARDEPPPLDTDEAITSVLSGLYATRALPSELRGANCSLMTYSAKRIALSVSLPQSFSGFCCECACLNAMRLGSAARYAARSASERSAVKLEFLPAAFASLRRPFCRLTVLLWRSFRPMPVPLSV
jgi:hypothetical protein